MPAQLSEVQDTNQDSTSGFNPALLSNLFSSSAALITAGKSTSVPASLETALDMKPVADVLLAAQADGLGVLGNSNALMAAIEAVSSNPLDVAAQVYEQIFSFYGLLFQTLLTDVNDNTPPPTYDPLFTTQTPASDIAFAGFGDYQLVFGRAGNDTLYPFDHALNPSVQTPVHIDVFFGDSEVIKLSLLQDTLSILGGTPPATSGPFLPTGRDRFVLGDAKTSYFDQAGYNDFAFVYDFNPNQDTIQLRGSASDYETLTVPLLGSAIFEKKAGSSSIFEDDLVGIVFGSGNYDLDPNAAYFKYVDDAPAAPVQPEIKQFGTAGLDIPTAITADLSGNIYAAGFTSGNLNGTTQGGYDVWVNKYSADGSKVWGKQFGSSKSETSGFGLATDKLGNIYLAGGTAGNLAGPLQAQNSDAFLVKLDSDGNQLWGRQFGSDYLSGATNVAVDDRGDVYVSGLTVLPDPRPASDPNKVFPVKDDFWATKYDSSGNQQWFTQVAAPLNSPALFAEAYGITLNTDGSVYTTGWTYGDFSGQGQFNAYDAQIAKYNSGSGQLEKFSPNPGQLVNQFGTPSFEFSYSIDHDSQGNLYNAGWTYGSLGGPNAGEEDVFIAKTRLDGTQEWIRQFGTSGADGLFIGGLKVDANDNIFVTGYTNGSLEGANAGTFDAWVARYDTSGNRVWIQQFGTAETDYSTNLTVDNLGNVYVTGYTEGALGSVNAGAIDTWIAKLNAETGSLKSFDLPTPPEPPVSDQTLYGTSENDVLVGGNGNDTIYGNGGSDILTGGNGNNQIYGGSGNDQITAGSGNDTIYGNGGNDSIVTGAGDDLIYVGSGKNYIDAGAGSNTLYLGSGQDQILLSRSGTDTVYNYSASATRFKLGASLSYSDLKVTQSDSSTLISTTAGEKLALLAWTQTSSVTASSFI